MRAGHRGWRWGLCAPVLLGLTACSLGPSYRRPDVPLPPAWSTAANAEASPPEKDWWRGFGSVQLDDLIARAQASNDDIGAAMARVREADAQARIAGAALLPSLTGTASATRERAQPETGGPPRTFDVFTPAITASYELDFWGRNRDLHQAALAAARASRFDRETVALTVMTSVAMSYFEVLEFQDRLQVAQQNYDNAQTILKDLELEARVGTATALDVAQQATTVATLDAAIPPLAQQLRQSMDALAILTGQPPELMTGDQGSLDALTLPAVGAGLPSQLLARRPDVAEAEAQLIGANANIAAARAAFFPSFDLTATGGYASSALGTLLSPASRVFALSAGLTQTIFDNGALTGQYRFERARYDELLSDYHKTVLTALGNVEDALVAVQQSAEQQLRQQDATDKARRAFDLAQLQFKAGTISVLTLLNTETALFSAQDALVQGKFAHLQALLTLYQALGGGWRQEQP
ncbi:MAG TPA: efflux transporter outer membrane subunit [Steroidobacteraceae bacterium]